VVEHGAAPLSHLVLDAVGAVRIYADGEAKEVLKIPAQFGAVGGRQRVHERYGGCRLQAAGVMKLDSQFVPFGVVDDEQFTFTHDWPSGMWSGRRRVGLDRQGFRTPKQVGKAEVEYLFSRCYFRDWTATSKIDDNHVGHQPGSA
jgi:hypothetical protein